VFQDHLGKARKSRFVMDTLTLKTWMEKS